MLKVQKTLLLMRFGALSAGLVGVSIGIIEIDQHLPWLRVPVLPAAGAALLFIALGVVLGRISVSVPPRSPVGPALVSASAPDRLRASHGVAEPARRVALSVVRYDGRDAA